MLIDSMRMDLGQTILTLIEREDFQDQSALGKRLEETGVMITQPTLSRHLRRLQVRKIRGVYHRVDSAVVLTPVYSLVPVPPNLLVLRTRPGHAQLLALRLDNLKLDEIQGTLAGDDTVFIACRGTELERLTARIDKALGRPESV